VYLLGIPVYRTARDSTLTQALPPEQRTETRPDWHTLASFTLLSPSVSPHYSFHLAGAQIHQLQTCWESAEFTPAAKQESAKAVVRLWQEHRRYWDASEYTQAVRDLVRNSGDRRIDVEDLPHVRSSDAISIKQR
jgi:hypothetical protein